MKESPENLNPRLLPKVTIDLIRLGSIMVSPSNLKKNLNYYKQKKRKAKEQVLAQNIFSYKK